MAVTARVLPFIDEFNPLSYEELLRIRKASADWLELIDGELIVTPSPTPYHQIIVQRLYDAIKPVLVAQQGIVFWSPLDVKLSDHVALQPDLFVITKDRSHLLNQDPISGPPSLVIEVLSPSTTVIDRGRKRELYAYYGVPEYWVVDPEGKLVTIHAGLADGTYQSSNTTCDAVASTTIPGLSIDLKPIFASLHSAFE